MWNNKRRKIFVSLAVVVLAVTAITCVVWKVQTPSQRIQTVAAHVEHARQLRKDGQFEAAVAQLSMAIAEDPFSAESYYERGQVFFETERLESAVSDFGQAVAIKRGFSEAIEARGHALLLLGRYHDAAADFSVLAHQGQGELRARASYWAGDAYSGMKDWSTAAFYYSISIAVNPDSVDALLARGIAYGNLRLDKLALRDFEQVLKLDPEYGRAYADRGMVRYRIGEIESALEDFNLAIRLAPEFSPGWSGRADVFRKQGEYQRAVEDYNEAIRLAPEKPRRYAARGYCLHRLGHYQAAIQDFDKALQLNPHLAAAYGERAKAYEALGDGAKAERDRGQYEEILRRKSEEGDGDRYSPSGFQDGFLSD